jgi:hypothetical protein
MLADERPHRLEVLLRGLVDRRRVTIRAVPAKMRRIDRLYDAYGAEMAKILAG